MNVVVLDRPFATRLLHQAQKYPDVEVCGIVGARDGRPCSIYPVANVASQPREQFDMEPADQIAAFRRLREAGETLFAIYHSHPAAPAKPSAADAAGMGYPEAISLIMSLDIRGVLALRAWRYDGCGFHELPLEVRDTADGFDKR